MQLLESTDIKQIFFQMRKTSRVKLKVNSWENGLRVVKGIKKNRMQKKNGEHPARRSSKELKLNC
ncbi:hypothetical protein GCM10011274_26970 [Paraglaciecola chathamensis]|uniref:Uncharacterized protein n=1 Tax=Paraglaciecola chathamensis TaxID=368405 RepID=A0A8H9IBG7_9ALTE|nr:hypothetical protein GCM10011274_26970 [Paraglaciecola oceanifecundans]